ALRLEPLGAAVEVRVIGVSRCDPEGDLLAAARDPRRDAALLERKRPHDRAIDLVVLPVEGRDAGAPRLLHDLDALAEPTEALLDLREPIAVRAPLVLVPTGADPHLDPAAGDDVDGRRDLREIGGVAV